LCSGLTEAFDAANKIAEGVLSSSLETCIETNLPKSSGKKTQVTLGVYDVAMARVLKERFPGYKYESRETSPIVDNLLRGIRLHGERMLPNMTTEEVATAARALTHAYSRGQVKFNATRDDVHIMQRSAALESIDKGVNTLAMRLREWYSAHFPELITIVSDNFTYAKLARAIGDKATLTSERVDELAKLLDDDQEKAEAIVTAARQSMGPDLKPVDMAVIMDLAELTVNTFAARRQTATQLDEKVGVVAPNLRELLGSTVAARLITQAGSLVSLAKCPASTVQILGAEKALFRALKTKGNTPKYGVLYHSSAIGKASAKNKGRMSRYVANKCAIASRIDAFSATPSNAFGQALKQQVDDRLEFYSHGKVPPKNAEVMASVMQTMADIMDVDKDDVMQDGEPKGATKDENAAKNAEKEARRALKAAKKAKKADKEKKRKAKTVTDDA
jgi:nucleolar protein 56